MCVWLGWFRVGGESRSVAVCCVHVHLQLRVQLLLFNAEKVERGNNTAMCLLLAPPVAPPIPAPPTLLVHVGSHTGAH